MTSSGPLTVRTPLSPCPSRADSVALVSPWLRTKCQWYARPAPHAGLCCSGGSPNSLNMVRQLSRGASDAFFTSAYSGAVDNLPGPFQPPPSNATSEDVHVSAGTSPSVPLPGARLPQLLQLMPEPCMAAGRRRVLMGTFEAGALNRLGMSHACGADSVSPSRSGAAMRFSWPSDEARPRCRSPGRTSACVNRSAQAGTSATASGLCYFRRHVCSHLSLPMCNNTPQLCRRCHYRLPRT